MPIDYNDTGIVTGAIANITDGADEVPIKSWGVTVDANLSGVSSVVCTQAGKNVIDISGTDTDNGYISGRWISSSNSPNTNADWYTTEYLPILPNTEYTLSGIAYGNSPAFCFYDETKTYISGTAYSNRSTITFTSPNNAKYARFSIRNDFTAFMLEIGATATTYEAYTAPTVSTVPLGRTIYGGEVDVVAGTGTSEYALITFDGTQTILAGNYGTSGYVQYACSMLDIDPDIDKPLYDLQPGIYIDASTGNYRINSLVSGGTKRIRFNDIRLGDTITSKDEWNAYLSQNPVTVAYPLATPETFTFPPITPTPETPLGASNFWADEGDSELTYYKDGYGYTSVTVHKETPEGEPVEETRKFHRIIYEGQVDVISGTGLINIGESGTEYDPPEQISFTPVEIATDEGENTFYADEGVSVITYRREVE